MVASWEKSEVDTTGFVCLPYGFQEMCVSVGDNNSILVVVVVVVVVGFTGLGSFSLM